MQTGQNLQIRELSPPDVFTIHTFPESFPLQPGTYKWNSSLAKSHLDALLELTYDGATEKFAVEYRKKWDQRDFQSAIEKLRNYHLPPTIHPLVVLPYLSEERLTALEQEGMNGIDYCGNGVIKIPGRWYIRTTGRPNRFKLEAQALKNPYRGKASLVGRTLLSCPVFPKLEDLYEAIQARGGEISLALVSRAIKRLEDDAITRSHQGNKVWLLQPEKLLDALVLATRTTRTRRLWQGKVAIANTEILPRVFSLGAENLQRLIVTGLGSATYHANLAMEKTIRVYVGSNQFTNQFISALLTKISATETTRFPDLEIYAAPDDTVFYDAEEQTTEQGTVRWASLLQTYIEMQQSDSRLHDSAVPLRDRLLQRVKDKQNA